MVKERTVKIIAWAVSEYKQKRMDAVRMDFREKGSYIVNPRIGTSENIRTRENTRILSCDSLPKA